MELIDYIQPPNKDDLPAVIETDHALLINGMVIPYVAQDSVVCKRHKSVQEVTITLLASSFVRMFGKAGEAFEKEIGLKRHGPLVLADKQVVNVREPINLQDL